MKLHKQLESFQLRQSWFALAPLANTQHPPDASKRHVDRFWIAIVYALRVNVLAVFWIVLDSAKDTHRVRVSLLRAIPILKKLARRPAKEDPRQLCAQ